MKIKGFLLSSAVTRSVAVGVRRHGLFLLVIAVIIVIFMWPLLTSSDYPWGPDALLHTAKVQFLTDHFLEYHTIPQWMHNWYQGYPWMQYYGPLTYLVALPINLVLENVLVTYKILIFLCLFAGAALTYMVALRWLCLPRVGATLAGLAYVLSPFNMFAIFSHGGLPRALSLALTPLVLYLVLSLLDHPRRRAFVALTLSVAALVITHHSQAAIILILLAVFTLVYIIARNISLHRSAAVLLSIVFGLGLCLWWLIPAVTHIDLPTVPWVRPDFVPYYSHHLSLFNPFLGIPPLRLAYFSLPLIVFSVVALLLRRDAMSLALVVSALVGIIYALGINTPIYSILPLHSMVIPERFLYPVSLLLALTAASLLYPYLYKRLRGRLWLVIPLIVLIVFSLDYAPYRSLVGATAKPNWEAPMQVLASSSNQGRFDNRLLTYESEDTYLPIVEGRKWVVCGGSHESTPHAEALYAMTRAEAKGFPLYTLHNYALWNTRFVLIDNSRNELLSALEEAGFSSEIDDGTQSLMVSDKPSSYFMVQDRSILVVGRGAEIATSLFPWVSRGTSWYLEDYDPQFLATFDGVLLTSARSRDPTAIDRIIRGLLSEGKLVVVEEPLMDQGWLARANKSYIDTPSSFNISAADDDGLLGALPTLALKPFPSPWRPPSYVGVDTTLVSADIGGRTVSIVGYNELEEGRVYFIGLSLFNHALLTNDEVAIALGESILNLANPNKSLQPQVFPVEEQAWTSDAMSFQYSSEESGPVIVSMTYSPHWKAMVDDQPLEVYNYENLCLAFLPAGQHQVQFEYGTTPIQVASLFISVISLISLVLFLRFLWDRFSSLGKWNIRDVLVRAWHEYDRAVVKSRENQADEQSGE